MEKIKLYAGKILGIVLIPFSLIKKAWIAIPAQHKLSLIKAIALYILFVIGVITWIEQNSETTIKEWNAKFPNAKAVVKLLEDKGLDPEFKDSVSAFSNGDKIAIVISGLGLSKEITEKSIKDLPPEFNMAFSPYADNLEEFVKKSTEKKHENLVLVPMESSKYPEEDAGPKAMSLRLDVEANKELFNWAYNRVPFAVGVINYMGSRFLSDNKQVKYLLDDVKEKNTILIENPLNDKFRVSDIGTEGTAKLIKNDIYISKQLGKENFVKQLVKAENIAKEKSYAVIIIEPYPLAIGLLKNWSVSLKQRGFILSPITSVWKNTSNHE